MEWDTFILIAVGAPVVGLTTWLLIIAARSSGKLHHDAPTFRRPPKVRMYEAAEGRIDRLREKTFAELEAMPAREDRKQVSRRRRKYRIATTKRRLENGSLLFTVVARERTLLRPWVRVELQEVFPPDHQPRRPLQREAVSSF